jgi:hypothetical protein
MPIPYEILIRGNPDGTLSGCHVIDSPGSDARPVTPADLAAVAPAINADAIAQIEVIKADLDAKNALIDSAKNSIKSAIADAKLDPEATVSAIAEIVATAELPSIEKRKATLAAEIEAKKAELESL